jgi:serine/threonine protein kinase/tetratricopeptide (TPR) repeat protein
MAMPDLNEEAIFDAARQIATPDDRRLYVQRACGDNAALRARVEALLRLCDREPNFLEPPTGGVGRTVADPVHEGPGATVGPYQLRERLGEGGFGVVWLAEQQRPVRRQVALKVLKPGMDTKQVVARFEAERQALALMDHPNIARVYDGGATASGRPYFVMELVRGVPVTDFCDQHHLTVRQRLGLFVSVCQAVQHAHQKGVIHRDLKPSNVLVARHEGTPVVKVIDFGIAKALGQHLTDKTLVTHVAQVVGTPLYMSPEQAELSGRDIDTRTDVYALGVLLYELLTGTTPFDPERLRAAGFDELRRIIREEEPARPSARITTIADVAATVAANRGSDPKRLSRLLHGELDWIVLKCLEKDRTRRYETASGLARDVQRYLNDEPVEAGPPTARYRLHKFLRRHKGPVIAASALAVALLAGIAGTTWGLVRAEVRRTEAEQAKEESQKRLAQVEKAGEILGSIFVNLDPKAVEKGDKLLEVILGERLDLAVQQLDGEAVGDPLVVARLQDILGEALRGLGYFDKAIVLFAKARDTRQARQGRDHPDTLTSMNNLALSYNAAGQLDRALPLCVETLERRKATLGPDHPDTLTSMNNLATYYLAAGQFDRALPLLEETFQLIKAKRGPDHPDTLTSMSNLAWGYQAAGQLDRALPLFAEVLERRKATLRPDHPDVLTGMNNLATGYLYARQLDRALPLCVETLERRKATLGPGHPDTLNSMNNLAEGYRLAGKLDLALPLLEETLRLIKEKRGPDHPKALASMNNLALGYRAAGQFDRALPLLEETLRLFEAKLSAGHPDTLTIMGNLGDAYLAAKQPEKALPLLTTFLAGQKKHLGPDSPRLAGVQAAVAASLLRHQQFTAAEQILRECLAIREKQEPDVWTTFHTRSLLGAALLGQQKYADAEPLLVQCYQGMREKGPGQNSPGSSTKQHLTEALERLVQLYDAWGKEAEAARWRKELEQVKARQN